VGSAALAADTFVGPDRATLWEATGRNEAVLDGGALTISQFESVTGGSADDTFRFLGAAAQWTGAVLGGLGADTLDYSALVDPITFTVATNLFPRVGSQGALERVMDVNRAVQHRQDMALLSPGLVLATTPQLSVAIEIMRKEMENEKGGLLGNMLGGGRRN